MALPARPRRGPRGRQVTHGVCIRPVQMRRTDLHTGPAEPVDIPCGATLDAKCPPCAKRTSRCGRRSAGKAGTSTPNRSPNPDPPNEEQRWLDRVAAPTSRPTRRGRARPGEDTAELDELIAGLDAEINPVRDARQRPARPGRCRRHRSTRRRQDAPDLPRRKVSPAHSRPDLHRAGRQGLPAVAVRHPHLPVATARSATTAPQPTRPPTTTRRAARDALHFAALFDRFIQNLRRFLGYDVQYFASVEPQRRLAPHLHIAMRGTLPRAELRQVARRDLPPGVVAIHRPGHATTATICRSGTRPCGDYLDPATGELLPTWDEALDAIGDHEAEPLHVARFGAQVRRPGRPRRIAGLRTGASATSPST